MFKPEGKVDAYSKAVGLHSGAGQVYWQKGSELSIGAAHYQSLHNIQ